MFQEINWRYAIGEIIIVIIGITIAFAMNNWAESRNNATYKKKYLQGLLLDLEKDQQVLQKNIESCQLRIKDIQSVFPHLGRVIPGRDTIFRTIGKIAGNIEFNPHQVTYQTLVNSGDYKLIDNFELRSAIEEHYSGYQNILKDYERQTNISKTYLGPFFINDINYTELYQGKHSYQDNPTLRNILQSLFGTLNMKISASKNGVESCQEVMDIIQKELDR